MFKINGFSFLLWFLFVYLNWKQHDHSTILVCVEFIFSSLVWLFNMNRFRTMDYGVFSGSNTLSIRASTSDILSTKTGNKLSIVWLSVANMSSPHFPMTLFLVCPFIKSAPICWLQKQKITKFRKGLRQAAFKLWWENLLPLIRKLYLQHLWPCPEQR